MKKKRQQAEQGVPVGELRRQVGVSEQSFYRWKKVDGGLQASEVRELDLSLDKVMLQDVIQKQF